MVTQIISLPNAFNIKNPPQLIDDLNKTEVQQTVRLASFEIFNVYTNTPVMYLRCIIESSLKLNSIETQQKQEFLKIYDLLINQNYFSHNVNLLCQNEKLPMGAPSSALLSKVFLQYIESNFITDILNINKVLEYF